MAWFSKPFSPKDTLPQHPTRPLYLHNTMGDKKETFTPPENRTVRMYNCGPTVYGEAHIGNLRSYIFADTVRRTLEYNALPVSQVINITDVGHLTSDADQGEDKMSKGLRAAKMDLTLENMHTLAEKYAAVFLGDLEKLNINTTHTQFPRASEYIDAMIAMILALEQKGYTYTISGGVYFDTSRFPDYGKLGNIKLEAQEEGTRLVANDEKRHPADFNLWKLDEKLGWKSPWGQGFPGWHIECSAMSRSLLGEQLDIHTGGMDHIPVHHNNEIAQSEAATGKKPFARFWLHNAFITLNDERIAKSTGNTLTLAELGKEGVHPLALRYFYLTAHYRSEVNFSLEAIKAAQQALLRLHFLFKSLPEDAAAKSDEEYQRKFHEHLNEDLDTPGAIALMWQMLKDERMTPPILRATLVDFDRALGLALLTPPETLQSFIRAEFGEVVEKENLPEDIKNKVTERDAARIGKDWPKADALRDEIQQAGYAIEDTPTGSTILKK